MHYLIDNTLKIIFGWSPKCGCSHIKRIFFYLKNNAIDIKNVHTLNGSSPLPKNIKEYTTIIISRNPYKRIVSGFLDKYNKNGQFAHMWKHKNLTFSLFVDELSKSSKMIEGHHFSPQTSERFSEKVLNSKCIKFYDIENIDYGFIEGLYSKKIPDEIMCRKEGHERKIYNAQFEKDVCDLDINEYFEYNVPVKNFYNDSLKDKIYKIYIKDFDFFKKIGLDYNAQV